MLAGVGAPPASGQSCGSLITQSTVLRTNIGPCACTGLIVADSARNITLNLAGHIISGTGSGYGVEVRGYAVVVTGPGNITGFADGIRLALGSQRSTIEKLTLSRNRIGVNLLGNCCPNPEGSNSILQNTIQGPGEVGTDSSGVTANRYAGNRVTGQSRIGLNLRQDHSLVMESNVVENNEIGVYLDGYSSPALVRENEISSNALHGLVSLSRIFAENNGVRDNGGDGILVAAAWPGAVDTACILRNNRVLFNRGRGIVMGGWNGLPNEPSPGHTAGGMNRVEDNFV